MAIWVDHVIYAVADMDGAADRLQREHGLVSVLGGTHPTGTCNRIVNLEPPQYLELLGIADRETLLATAVGRSRLQFIGAGGGLMGWAVGTDDIESVARRTGGELRRGSIHRADGTGGAWQTLLPPSGQGNALPFFIQYEGDREESNQRRRRNYDDAASPARPERFSWIEVACDAAAAQQWLGNQELGLRLVPGEPGLRAIGIATADGEIVIRQSEIRGDVNRMG